LFKEFVYHLVDNRLPTGKLFVLFCLPFGHLVDKQGDKQGFPTGQGVSLPHDFMKDDAVQDLIDARSMCEEIKKECGVRAQMAPDFESLLMALCLIYVRQLQHHQKEHEWMDKAK
jgi:hypothetical protein